MLSKCVPLLLLMWCMVDSQSLTETKKYGRIESPQIPPPPPDPDTDMPPSWKTGESEYATENDGTIEPVKNPFYKLRGYRVQQRGEKNVYLKKQFRILNDTMYKRYHVNVSIDTALKAKASEESDRNCVNVKTCRNECDKVWFNKNHLSWHVDRDNLTDAQIEEMRASKCHQGCCLRRGEEYRYCSKQCWRWYIVEVTNREKHFLECKTGCDLRCKDKYQAVIDNNDGDDGYCDRFKLNKQFGHGQTRLDNFVPNITPTEDFDYPYKKKDRLLREGLRTTGRL